MNTTNLKLTLCHFDCKYISLLFSCYCRFDIGEIVAQEKLDIHPDEILPELYVKLAKMGANILVDVIRKLPQILSFSRPQEKIGITYGNFTVFYLSFYCCAK